MVFGKMAVHMAAIWERIRRLNGSGTPSPSHGWSTSPIAIDSTFGRFGLVPATMKIMFC